MTQPTRNQKIAAGTVAAAIAVATPVIMAWEGYRPVGYRDIVGVATACYGHTGPEVRVGRDYTAQCDDMLRGDVQSHAEGIRKCIYVDVPVKSFAAFVSFGYNVGVSAFCKSTLARKLNAGDLRGACAGLSAWVYAGGKKVRGLENRRKAERALCEQGLAP